MPRPHDFSATNSTLGFEDVKRQLGIGSNTLSKLIKLHLINRASGNERNRYTGTSIEKLFPARSNYLRIPKSEEKALICSIGYETGNCVPSMYVDATGPRNLDRLIDIKQHVTGDEWVLLENNELRVTGYWSLSKEDSDFLTEQHCLVLASYAGFILDGGRLIREIEGIKTHRGRRAFLVEPLGDPERETYAQSYLLSRQGPINRVLTAAELETAAEDQAEFDSNCQR
ncbi:hypothetical protein [Schaalia sp. lx-260]|uniref:hypothetical protein n=1 Tax=Schaalia sp. lx-260 TaxID=2899082 RepID=UPI001E355F06|nr:hypothetical protein [Schaalia sp. lx-260]MCD4549163.1 hypothetical protein [Schaalia sp. lx-260]